MKWSLETSDTVAAANRDFEIVERKGLGHPDTLCDALAEAFSVALSRFYLDRFGMILHHNVDKVLLVGGTSQPRFGGGEVTSPIELFFAGRATRRYKGVEVPVEELAIETSHKLLRDLLPVLDPARHLRIHCLVRPGSEDLVELFARRRQSGVWLANDSSIGAGFAPLSPVEETVLALDRALGDPALRAQHKAFGTDTKLLALRHGERKEVTIACAFCDRHVASLEDYFAQKTELAAIATKASPPDTEIAVNAADDRAAGSIYLTVMGTSAEAGDDGEAGRGNRANGLITPCRPMTMEGVAGKNPVSHVGKLYNIVARDIAAAILREIPEFAAVECYLASRIGAPVAEPDFIHLRVAPRDSRLIAHVELQIATILHTQLAALNNLWQRLLDRSCAVF